MRVLLVCGTDAYGKTSVFTLGQHLDRFGLILPVNTISARQAKQTASQTPWYHNAQWCPAYWTSACRYNCFRQTQYPRFRKMGMLKNGCRQTTLCRVDNGINDAWRGFCRFVWSVHTGAPFGGVCWSFLAAPGRSFTANGRSLPPPPPPDIVSAYLVMQTLTRGFSQVLSGGGYRGPVGKTRNEGSTAYHKPDIAGKICDSRRHNHAQRETIIDARR